MKRLLITLIFVSQAVIVTAAGATTPTDYVGLTDKYNDCNKRLNSQKNVLRPSLEYVRNALAKFDAQEAKLTKRAANLRGAASRAQARLNNNELDICTVTFRGRQVSISDAYSIAQDAEKKAGLCQKYKAEAMLDERTLSDRMKEIDRLASELAEWKKENDDAVTEAMMVAIEQIIGKCAKHLCKESLALKRLKDAVARREKSLRNAKKAEDLKAISEVSAILTDAQKKYNTAWRKAKVGLALKKMEPVTLWKLFQNEVSLIIRGEALASDQVRAVLNDPKYSHYVKEALPAGKEILDIFSQKGAETAFGAMAGTVKLVPYMGIAFLIRDTSYAGLKWWKSLEQVTSRIDLTDKSFQATKSLVTLIEKRKPKWNSVLED